MLHTARQESLNGDEVPNNITVTISQENAPVVSIDGHEDVPENSEDDLMKAVAHQPVSVAIDAGSSDFQFFSEVRIRA